MTHSDFMRGALSVAKQSGNDVPVGAVIVENGEIIAQAHNLKEELNDVTAHAEILAIKKATTKKGNWRLENCSMYVTLEPCPMCASAIINSRLKEVYFGAYDNVYGALGSVLDLRKTFNSKLKVTGGILEKEAAELLKNFWRENEKSQK